MQVEQGVDRPMRISHSRLPTIRNIGYVDQLHSMRMKSASPQPRNVQPAPEQIQPNHIATHQVMLSQLYLRTLAQKKESNATMLGLKSQQQRLASTQQQQYMKYMQLSVAPDAQLKQTQPEIVPRWTTEPFSFYRVRSVKPKNPGWVKIADEVLADQAKKSSVFC